MTRVELIQIILELLSEKKIIKGYHKAQAGKSLYIKTTDGSELFIVAPFPDKDLLNYIKYKSVD